MRLNHDVVFVATKNKGKIKEFADLFGSINKQVRSLADYPDVPDVIEDGMTFAQNAEKKARALADHVGLPVLADDSGLCVDALGGEPGVFSARYAGDHAGDEANNEKLLHKLREVRGDSGAFLSRAQFVCALALYDPETGETIHVQGECEGQIVPVPRGTNGFGYDPLFYVPSYGKTMAELSMEDKNKISHRGQAIQKLLILLQSDSE